MRGVDEWKDGWMSRWMDDWRDEWMGVDVLIDGGVGKQMGDGWIDDCVNTG